MTEESYGFLSVSVRTAGGALPVSDAIITVKSDDGENSDVIAVMRSDAGGITESYRLPAPPKSYGLSPEAGIPYKYYNIDTDKEGYYSVRNIKVPIYAEVTAIQPVDMIPIALYLGSGSQPDDLTRFDESQAPDL